MSILADHDIEGLAVLLFRTLETQGWLSLLEMRLVRFSEIGIPATSTDREVWHTAQAYSMLLLTDNRSMSGVDTLEEIIRGESISTSLPVLTLSTSKRLRERYYREACAERLVEIALDLEAYRGTGHLFLP
ncbi:MAG: ACP S-malonyltransferase [Ktedonobacterales bacterium]|nr:ACP S-malonyltransferase [Ktedonobacterales bacterium]